MCCASIPQSQINDNRDTTSSTALIDDKEIHTFFTEFILAVLVKTLSDSSPQPRVQLSQLCACVLTNRVEKLGVSILMNSSPSNSESVSLDIHLLSFLITLGSDEDKEVNRKATQVFNSHPLLYGSWFIY